LAGQITVHLSPATNQAFDKYVSAAEAKMDWKAHLPARTKNVEVAAWEGNSPIEVESGLIHDWVASILVPGASAEQALALFQGYDQFKQVFGRRSWIPGFWAMRDRVGAHGSGCAARAKGGPVAFHQNCRGG
jgi:hypothetical protein